MTLAILKLRPRRLISRSCFANCGHHWGGFARLCRRIQLGRIDDFTGQSAGKRSAPLSIDAAPSAPSLKAPLAVLDDRRRPGRYGTVSLLAAIDLVTGKVHALAKDRHRSREFIEFLELLDAAYPAQTAIKLILDNHSAHISKETRAWLAGQPAHRFEFTFTPNFTESESRGVSSCRISFC